MFPFSLRHYARLQRLLEILALAYLLGLFCLMAVMHCIGERWWASTVLLYVPRAVFIAPLLLLVPLIALAPTRRSVFLMASSALICAVPLAGLRFHTPTTVPAGAFTLRIASCNMATGSVAVEGIVQTLSAAHADLILLQESEPNLYTRLAAAATGYQVVANGQFWFASRYPVVEVREPPKIDFHGVLRSPRFLRYRLSTPHGDLLVYNVHFISPRDGLEELRGDGFLHELRRGRLLSTRSAEVIGDNSQLRELQMAAVHDDAVRAGTPAVIVGDTNLPGLSRALADVFGDYRDAFDSAGRGLGYTFPAPRHAWMRIDRLLVDRRLRVLDFQVIRQHLSDHYPIIGTLAWPT